MKRELLCFHIADEIKLKSISLESRQNVFGWDVFRWNDTQPHFHDFLILLLGSHWLHFQLEKRQNKIKKAQNDSQATHIKHFADAIDTTAKHAVNQVHYYQFRISLESKQNVFRWDIFGCNDTLPHFHDFLIL